MRDTIDAFYRAFADRDRDTLARLLHPEFVGRVSAGMPSGVGGVINGPDRMVNDVWAATSETFDSAPEPEDVVRLGPRRAVVFGFYRGVVRDSGRWFEAAFAHDIVMRDGVIASLVQITDTHLWHTALNT